MDFELSEQQTALRELVRDFARKSIRPVAREWELSGRYPQEIVDQMKAMGLFGMLVPQEYGGIAIDAVSYSLVFEEIARAWMGVAGILGTHSLATLMLTRYGTPEQRRRWLPDLATGERRSGIALTEPQAGSDLQGITTAARRDGDHYIVNGAKTWITNARHADPLPVLVKTDPAAQPRHRGMSVLMIEQETPGFTVGKDLDKLGYKGPESSEVFLSDCRVPVANLLGGVEGHGLQQALAALEFGRVNIAGRAVGVAQASLDRALAYARDRRAFGRPIAEFQAVQLNGHRDPGRAPLDQVGCRRPGFGAPRRPRDRDGQAVCVRGLHQGIARSDADPRRLRLLDRVRGRAVLPRCAADGDRRGHQRHPPHSHRASAGRIRFVEEGIVQVASMLASPRRARKPSVAATTLASISDPKSVAYPPGRSAMAALAKGAAALAPFEQP